MDLKKIATCMSIGGTIVGVIASGLGIAHTIDEMKNGVKLRDDQMASLSHNVATEVSSNVLSSYNFLAGEIVEAYYAKQNKGQNK